MSLDRITELNKLKRPPKGRPKNKFVYSKDYWCLSHLMYCDKARMDSKCREEAARHTMPFPFENFDCNKYIIIPKKCMKEYSQPFIDEALKLTIGQAVEASIGLIDCKIKLLTIKENKEEKCFEIEYSILVFGRQKNSKIVVIKLDFDKITSYEA